MIFTGVTPYREHPNDFENLIKLANPRLPVFDVLNTKP